MEPSHLYNGIPYTCKDGLHTETRPRSILPYYKYKWFFLYHVKWSIYSLVSYVIIGSDNALSPDQLQAIIWTNAEMLLIQNLGTNFSEILSKIHTFSLKKMPLKIASAEWLQFCLSLNVSGNVMHTLLIQY